MNNTYFLISKGIYFLISKGFNFIFAFFKNKNYKKIRKYFEKEKQIKQGSYLSKYYDYKKISQDLKINEFKTIKILDKLALEGIIGFYNTKIDGEPPYMKYTLIYLR